MQRRGPAFWLLTGFFALFVLFLYGPTITILVLSFQGPTGGLTFPMQGVSVHWFGNLFEKQMVGGFFGSLERSMILARTSEDRKPAMTRKEARFVLIHQCHEEGFTSNNLPSRTSAST